MLGCVILKFASIVGRMDITALLTSAGINIAVCVVLFSVYSVLRKQPSNVNVYFGRRIAPQLSRRIDLCLDRFVPSPSWIWKAWETCQDEILAIGGLDAVVFVRILVFSLRIFTIAAIICCALVLPVNYYGRDRLRKDIPYESLEVFTIENVKEHSEWLWSHCLALYIITISACILLYSEYKSIANLRLVHVIGSPPNPSHFTILVRSIPPSSEESYSDTVEQFFSNYHAPTYLSHQMIYKSGSVQKLKDDAERICKVIRDVSMERNCKPGFMQCCGTPINSFEMISNEMDSVRGGVNYAEMHSDASKKECAAAFVFFKSRYSTLLASQILQTSNPMLWVTDIAPEPHDVYWSNIGIPYRQLWFRKIAILVSSIAFMLVFLIPVTFVQGMTQLDKLERMFPFMTGILQNKFVSKVVTGYLPSVVLVIFFYAVPPMMFLFSTVEGSISRSGRKKSACCKVLYFTIWNVFFVNIFTGSIISQLSVFSSVTDLPAQLAKAVPAQATFFTTYILSSGWASLAIEIMQIFPLLYNLFQRFILRLNDDSLSGSFTFPYHTEVPRVLLFGFLGFTCSILAPIMLPFLLIYFLLAYLVYKNQILNVYITKYDSGGQYWIIAYNTTIFALFLSQIIALGVFGLKNSSVASAFTIPLLIGTFLFHQYCKQRFHPVFTTNPAQVLIDMDRRDELSGRIEEIYEQLRSAYNQFSPTPNARSQSQSFSHYGSDQSSPGGREKGKETVHSETPWPIFYRSSSMSSNKAIVLGGMLK